MYKKIYLVIIFCISFFQTKLFSQDTIIIPSAKEIDASIQLEVSKLQSTYRYNYVIISKKNSKQNIYEFFLEYNAEIDSIISPPEWEGRESNIRKKIIYWSSTDSTHDILPNNSLEKFYIVSSGLPQIHKYYLRGYTEPLSFPAGEAPDLSQIKNWDIFENSFNVWTVGPNIYADDISLIEVTDSISSYTNRSGTYGWILREQTKNKYTQFLASTKTALLQNDSLLARTYLEKILREVDIDSSGAITSEAYALLRYNTEYLLSKLPVVTEPTNDLSAKVSAETITTNGILQYAYTITNEATSKQSVVNIYIEDKTTSTTTAPLNWQTEKVAATLDRFYTTTNQITAGAAQGGYTVTSNSLPVIGKVYVQSERYAVDTTDIKTNSYIVTTVTPAIRPAQINTSAFIDTLISYNNRAYTLGWMQYDWVRDNNYYQLNNAKTMINMNIPSSAVVILIAFEGWLDTIKNLAYINNEGYGLLKYNSIYLREKLSGQ